MATFIGSSQAGFPGALVATLGVVLPVFLIILLIAAVLKSLLRYRGVEAFLSGVHPTVVGLILGTAVVLGLAAFFSFGSLRDTSGVTHDVGAFLVLFCLLALDFASRDCADSPDSSLRRARCAGVSAHLTASILSINSFGGSYEIPRNAL